MIHWLPPARRACLALAFASLALLAGCVGRQTPGYPSLLPRSVETRSDALPEVAVAVADPATDAQLDTLRATLDKTQTEFAPAAANADRLARAARGIAIGDERWIAAQSALAELDGYRATLSRALSDIDSLAASRAADNAPEYPAITALRGDAQAAFDVESARIAAISAMLPAG